MTFDRRERRRVLLVSHVFPPMVAGGAPRLGQFARLLPEHGWDVTVIAAKANESSDIDRATALEISQRARVHRSWSPATAFVRRGMPVARQGVSQLIQQAVRSALAWTVFPDRAIFWVPGALDAASRVLREVRHDVVLASYAPASNLLLGYLLANRFDLPLVVDFRDLWSTLPVPLFATPAHRRAAFELEHAVVKRASYITAVAPTMATELARSHGFPPERAFSITNGFDPAHVARVLDRRAPQPRPFRLMYCGTVHVHYNFEPFWEALRSLAKSGELAPESFKVEFVGNLSEAEVRRQRLEDLVEISPFVPHEQVFDAMARADALLVLETPGYYARFGYAAKVFDYALTGKPVLGVVEIGGNTESFLRALGVGYCAAHEDVEGIKSAIRSVVDSHGRPPKPIDLDSPPLRDFNRLHLVRKLAEILEASTRLDRPGA